VTAAYHRRKHNYGVIANIAARSCNDRRMNCTRATRSRKRGKSSAYARVRLLLALDTLLRLYACTGCHSW